MTGVDVPIEYLRRDFLTDLWPNVDKKTFYGRVIRNIRSGDQILENFESGVDYKEIMFNDALNALCFFDVGNEISNIGDDPQRNVRIIFAVRLDQIYPGNLRADSEVQRDVMQVVYESTGVQPDSMDVGLTAYGDIPTEKLKKFNMHPWHTFSINVTLANRFQCDVTFPVLSLLGFALTFPIIFIN